MIIQIDTIENEASGFSLMANEIGAPMTHRINTLYTDIPMYLQINMYLSDREKKPRTENLKDLTLWNPILKLVWILR